MSPSSSARHAHHTTTTPANQAFQARPLLETKKGQSSKPAQPQTCYQDCYIIQFYKSKAWLFTDLFFTGWKALGVPREWGQEIQTGSVDVLD